ncbi:MAG: ATP-binding protein [Sulfurospirillaceae bacterium]|nr:ATP-binding protein [Sulfurospirillaceae bacterium]
MNFDFKQIESRFSTKSKTIILVSFVIIVLSLVFIYLRYVDEKQFLYEKQNFYIGKVQNIYRESKKSVDAFFTNRANANLESYGIKSALVQKNGDMLEKLSLPRWKVLKKEHPSLQSMAFYDDKFKLLSLLGDPKTITINGEKSDKHEVRSGFCYTNNVLVYKIIVPALNEKSENIGFLVISVEPVYFLNEIKKLIGFSGYIIYHNIIIDNSLSIHEAYDTTLLSEFLAREDKASDKMDYKGHYFKVHKINENDFSTRKIFNIIFFQDITSEHKQFKEAMIESLLIVALLWIIILIVLEYGFNILIKRLEESHQELILKEEKLALLNANLETRVSQEIEERMKKEYEVHEKERMLIHQSKLANMGEMIGNIAHQWRQPLTELSAILIAIELFFERGKLSAQKLSDKISLAQKQIEFMSQTIEDFRNFFASGKAKKLYNLEEPIKEALNLIHSSLHNNHIAVSLHINASISIEGYDNEIAQAVLNILSNAKDILIERAVIDPKITITIRSENHKGFIEIEDNGGGIQIEPIEKIFEPYFSTKHAKSGTGIGLYMCKSIIEKNNHGELYVTNTAHGALFTIILDAVV